MIIVPMFPLGSVLVPGMVVPLHVFEPRYRAMMEHCVANQCGFGVVLIARGSEVGGGETRHNVGCLADIRQSARLDDGRWHILCEGASPMHVIEWLVDDPYPQASVEVLPDDDPITVADSETQALIGLLRSTLGLATELGLRAADSSLDLPADPIAAVWKICAVAPLGDQDRLAVLEAPGFAERVGVLGGLLTEVNHHLRLELDQLSD